MNLVIANGISPALDKLAKLPRAARTMLEAGAKEVQVQIRKHLKTLQKRGNQKGWPSYGFYAGKPHSVDKAVGITSVTSAQAVVSIADPRFSHRITGGTVRPKRRKMLAIPLTAEAYSYQGKGSLRESFPGLFVVRAKRGVFLATSEFERRGGKRGRGRKGEITRQRLRFLFKLVAKVTHKPHPEEMPDQAELTAAANLAMRTVAARIVGVPLPTS